MTVHAWSLSVCFLLAGTLPCCQSTRVRRKGHVPNSRGAKTIAGLPVINHESPLVQAVQDTWVLVGDASSENELSRVCADAGAACALLGHPSRGGVPFVQLHGTEADLERWLKGSAGLQFLEPDSVLEAIPELDETSRAASGSGLWGLETIGAARRPNDGRGVNVYVIDTGIRTSHSDFGGRAASAIDVSSGSVRECNSARDCAGDVNGHGTHCAGTAVGTRFGVAPKARAQAVKTISDSGTGQQSWTVAALDWVGARGERPAVASLSLGARGNSQAMRIAVEAAVAGGVVVVAAAGNSNSNACDYSPAFVPSAITVGSTTSTNVRSSFSCFGPCVDVWAPGSNILSAGIRNDDDTDTQSGTSMACPHVSGAAALFLAQTAPRDILARLYENAAKGWLTGLFGDDKNELLYVGIDGPPPSASPTPAPTTCKENSSGPDSAGDCKCAPGYECWWGDDSQCPFSDTEYTGYYSRFYYLPSCQECLCWAM